ncbi:MAG: DUF2442 domain-containing protein [Candidatus Competibacteraceae bacterium]
MVTGNLYLTIAGEPMTFSLANLSLRLATASEEEKNIFEVSPSRYGIHWPLLDEEIAIDGLLGIVHRPSRKQRLA